MERLSKKPTAVMSENGVILFCKNLDVFGCEPSALDGLHMGNLVGHDTWIEWTNKLLERDVIEIPNTLSIVNGCKWIANNKFRRADNGSLELIAVELKLLDGVPVMIETLTSEENAIGEWLLSLPEDAQVRFGRMGCPDLNTPLEAANMLVVKCQETSTLKKLKRDSKGRIFDLFPKVDALQIIFKGTPKSLRLRGAKTVASLEGCYSNMGKRTTTIAKSAGTDRPRSIILESMPRLLNTYKDCTRAIHSKDGRVLAIVPDITEKRLALPVRELIGAPLSSLPNGLRQPIEEGLEEVFKSPDGYFENQYTYRWNDREWSFVVCYQLFKEAGEVVRCVYDAPGYKHRWQRDYWLSLVDNEPALAWN